MTPTPPRQDLREISHLFLSSVRDRQTGGDRPVRISPQQRAEQSVDLSPDELARVAGARPEDHHTFATPIDRRIPTVRCVLAGHLGPLSRPRVRDYAAGFLGRDRRSGVGLIELNTTEIRVSMLDSGVPTAAVGGAAAPETVDFTGLAAAIEELSHDVSLWVVALPQNPRVPEARALVHAASALVLLSTTDADATVGAYRTIKGLCDVLRRDGQPLPPLSLALPRGEAGATEATYQRLSTVARQFLGWSIRRDAPPSPEQVTAVEHMVLHCVFGTDRAAAGACYKAVAEFVARGASDMTTDIGDSIPIAAQPSMDHSPDELRALRASIEMGESPATSQSIAITPVDRTCDEDDVIELPQSAPGIDDSTSILSAVLSDPRHGLAGCAVQPPGCSLGRLSVSRDRCLTLVAVAGHGLAHLRDAARAYEWLRQNRALVAMALPQFAIDAHAMPRLLLLIDHADASEQELRPIMAAGQVSILTYRKLRWSGRTGLLLTAA